MTTPRSKSKQEIEFQYGGRPFSQTGSSFISTVDWVISSKFGMQIDFHYFERMQSLHLNTEVDFRLYDRHLKKSIWRQKSADVGPITAIFRRRVQNDMQIITHSRSKSTLEVKFQYGGCQALPAQSVERLYVSGCPPWYRECIHSSVAWPIVASHTLALLNRASRRVGARSHIITARALANESCC